MILSGVKLFSWFKSRDKRKQVREDRKYLEARARRLLKSYLSADAPQKHRYYEVVAGATVACQPAVSGPHLENEKLSQNTAEAALKVVKLREQNRLDGDLQSMITDGYAVVAIAHRRAAAAYTIDDEMQQLGTAAVHLVTMATSYMEKRRHLDRGE